MDHKAKGKEYYNKALKKVNPGFFDKIFSINTKYDIAILYAKSANHYKIAKEYYSAGRIYEKAYDIDGDIEYLENAAKCYTYSDPKLTITTYKKVAHEYLDKTKFNKVVEIYEKLADIYEEQGKINLAIKYYKDAIQYIDIDRYSYKLERLSIKLAKLYLDQERYFDIYELLYKLNTTTASLKMYKLLAGLCYLANDLDIIGAKKLEIGLRNQETFDNIILMIEENDLVGLMDIKIMDLTEGELILKVLNVIRNKMKVEKSLSEDDFC